MKFLASWRSLTARAFHRTDVEDELEQELQSHMEHRADDLERSGVKRSEAERRARIEFGGRVRFKEECRDALGGNFLDILMQDVRFSVRVLRKSPGFTSAAVLTLALAIGANAVVFGVMNGLILRPLNVPQAESLWGTQYGDNSGFESYRNYLDLRDRNRSFEGLAAFNFAFARLNTGNNSTDTAGYLATGNYFDVLRVRPYLGRFFHGSDEHGPNSAPYLVLSYAYWHGHFQSDPRAVGRVVKINKHPFTVIGVAPPEFCGTLLFIAPDFFIPIVNQPQVDGEDHLNVRGNVHGVFEAFGHLRQGITSAQADVDVNAVGALLERSYPREVSHKRSTLVREGLTSFGGPLRAFVAGLMLLAVLILVAACANLGSLFSARATDRSRDVALRLALGASRSRILRGLLTEAVLISIVGGAVGLLGSIALLRWLSTWQPFSGIPVHVPATPDARLYVIALALALVSGLLFGIIPVRQVLRTDPYEIVKAGSSSRAGRRMAMRDLLLAVQIAICALLVTSSLVALRGLTHSLHDHFGFEARNALLVSADLTVAGYKDGQVPAMQKRMISAIETIPGVEAVGLVHRYPPLINTAGTKVNAFKDGASDLQHAKIGAAPYRYEISPKYFRAAGTNLLVGRDFTWHDDKNAPAVAVVNREFAGMMFGTALHPIGRYFQLQDGTRVQVVGVVEDGKYQALTEEQQPAIFVPFLQSPVSSANVMVRSTRDTQELLAAIRNKLRGLDSGVSVDVATWSDQLALVFFPARVATLALGVLGAMGAMLSITGIFGMAAYSVSRRLKELGIRMAIGARRIEVLQTALGRALKLLAFGSAVGLLLGILASSVLASIVYQATPRDPLVLAGVVLAMALFGLVATWIPAQRALSLDPVALLREE